MIEDGKDARKAYNRGRNHEPEQLVAVRRIAEKAGALLVLADGDQDAPGRRCMEAQQREAASKSDHCDEPIIRPVRAQIKAKRARAHHAAKPAFTTSQGRPAVCHSKQHGR